MRGEDDILAIINRFFPAHHPSLLLGRGDDCAVLKQGAPLAVSTDIFAEDSHFRTLYFTPCDIGYKALAVNISDIGASGAAPTGFSLALTLTGREDEAWLAEFCRGMKELCERFCLAVSGGDLARSALMNICVTAWGELPQALPLGLRRGMAQEGDRIFLIGSIGLSRLGLTLLESCQNAKECEEIKKIWPEACAAHLHPIPLAEEGAYLARFALQHHLENRLSLMDVSDGLSRDLPRLLAAKKTELGADITLSKKNLSPEILRYAEKTGIDAAEFAFYGGEDYALAGTCPAQFWPELSRSLSALNTPFTLLGTVRKGPITLNGRIPQAEGFDHFSC